MEALFDQIRRRGLAVLQEIRDNREEETLHLEFKTLADHSSGALTKEDRRVLAKAICGLANAEGGTLLIGVSSKNVDAVDIAHELRPIAHVRRVRNRFVSALSEFLSPQHMGISEMVILDPAHPDAGYIAVNVPESDRRPHMSVSEHRYFRRGTTGTRVLEHAEVREMMLAVREASLQLSHRMKGEMSTADLYFSFKLILSVSNIGRVPAVAPYIKVTGASVRAMEGAAGNGFSLRQLPQGGGWGVYASRDILVHVEDIVDVAHIKTGLHIRLIMPGQDAKTIVAKVFETHDANVFTVAPFSQLRDPGSPDQLIAATIAYGAENVPVQHTTLMLDKWAMLKAMVEHL